MLVSLWRSIEQNQSNGSQRLDRPHVRYVDVIEVVAQPPKKGLKQIYLSTLERF